MKAEELRQLETEELQARLAEVERDFFKLRTQREVERITDASSAQKMRRDIARIKTVLRQRELAESTQPGGEN